MPQTSMSNSPDTFFAGMKYDSALPYIRSHVNEEASAEVQFGLMVGVGAADDGALLLAAITDGLAGINTHSQAYNKDNELGTLGLKPDVVMAIMRKGTVVVVVEEAVAPGDPVFVRAVATGGELAGAFRMQADASDCIDISAWASWLTTSTGAGLAALSITLP